MDTRDFRSVCSRFPTGITVVAREHGSARLGVTVSSFTSVSLAPPIVLVCIHERSSFLAEFSPGDSFSINILAAGQRHVAERFAKLPPGERFSPAQWDGTLLRGAAATLRCQLRELRPAGDHYIALGDVRDALVTMQEPLVYWRSAFHELAAPDGADSLAAAA